MTLEQATIKANNNQDLINRRYKIDTGENVTIRSVFPNNIGGNEWEAYCRILRDGHPADDNIHIIDNIDNLATYEALN